MDGFDPEHAELKAARGADEIQGREHPQAISRTGGDGLGLVARQQRTRDVSEDLTAWLPR